MINTELTVNGELVADTKSMTVKRSQNDFNTTSSFVIALDNFAGRHKSDFSVDQEVNIFADKDNLIMPLTSPIAHYKLNDNLATTVVIDSSGSNNGTSVNNTDTMSVSGKINNALEFNGTDDAVTMPSGVNLSSDNDFSFSLWVNVTSLPASGKASNFIGFRPSILRGIGIDISNNGLVEFKMRDDSEISVVGLVTNPSGFHHYVCTYNASTNTMEGFFDNVSQGTTSHTTTLISTDNEFGGQKIISGNQEFFDGIIDDIRIYNKVLTPGERSAIFNKDVGTEVENNSDQIIFKGLVDDIDFSGKGQFERLVLSGRDFGAILQDVIVSPRIFKDTETSVIVTSLMSQNISTITTTNVNVTTTTIDKITFTNVSVFDALTQLAETAGFFFYVDTNKDLHFEQRDSTSSGLTLDNTNTVSADFRTTDQDQFTKVTVQGDRQLTGANQIFTKGTDNTGSLYILDAKPSNTIVTLSGPTNTILQPGGILNINDPATEDVKFLVDFQGLGVTLTSGTTAGDNIQATGSVVIIDYQRSTPIISIKQTSANFPKHKVITDLNIKDINEASTKAQTFLDEHKDPKTRGTVEVDGIIDVTPGDTVIVNLPNQNQNSQSYAIMNSKYEFNPTNNLNDRVLTLSLNKKIANFVDIMKEQILRLRAIEAAEVDAAVTNVEVGTSEIEVEVTTFAISTSIGSGFYFHTVGPGGRHDQLNSPTALLGDMRTGSIVFQDGVKI